MLQETSPDWLNKNLFLEESGGILTLSPLPSPMFKRLSTVLMFVTNIASSKEWYKKFLSINPVEDLDNFASFKIGSTFLNFHLADSLSPLSKGGTIAYWEVDDLQKTIALATSLGGSLYRGPLFVAETSTTIAQILDPFGNVFGIESKDY